MGTTLDVVLVAGPEAFVAHVGDSRTYLIRDGRSSQITTDHTVAEVLVIEGKLTIEEAQVSPLRTILVNAIGVSADVGVEMAHVTLKRGDRLLLCSDGLHDYFPVEEEIAQKMSAPAAGEALKEMVELAKTRGGHDNITGVAVHVAEVVEGVPAHVDGESTQPVDLTGNPFAADEPTETAFLSPTIPARVAQIAPSTIKATQPMRAMDELGDTVPPLDVRKHLERLPTDPPEDKPIEAEKTEKADKDDKKAEKAPEKKKKKKKAKKADAEASADGEDAAKSDDADDDEDAAPTEIATADTGRVVVPKPDAT
jgi:hypothetical protein